MYERAYSTAQRFAQLTTSGGTDANPASIHFSPPPHGLAPRPGDNVNVEADVDDDAQLVALAKRDPMAMRRLLEHKHRLVLAVAHSYKGNTPAREFEDLVQLGRIGLHRAVHTYDPAKGAAFSTHATTLIRQEIWTKAVRPEKRHQDRGVRFTSLPLADPGDHPEALDDSPDFELDPFIRARTGSLLKTPRLDQARELVHTHPDLTPRQRSILLARLDGKRQRELGPKQTVSDIEARALKCLHSCK